MLDRFWHQVRPVTWKKERLPTIFRPLPRSAGMLGIVPICTIDGQRYRAGDATERFSIQSISKVLSLVMAMRQYEEEISGNGGKDPPGNRLTSSSFEIEQVTRISYQRAKAGGMRYAASRSMPRQRMLEIVRQLSGVDDIALRFSGRPFRVFEHSAR